MLCVVLCCECEGLSQVVAVVCCLLLFGACWLLVVDGCVLRGVYCSAFVACCCFL